MFAESLLLTCTCASGRCNYNNVERLEIMTIDAIPRHLEQRMHPNPCVGVHVTGNDAISGPVVAAAIEMVKDIPEICLETMKTMKVRSQHANICRMVTE